MEELVCLLESHEIRLGIGLSILHIEGCNYEFGLEDVGVVSLNALKERLLSRPCHHHGGDARCLYLLQEFVGSWHGLWLGLLVEDFGLELVDGTDFIFSGFVSSFTHGNNVDGACACAPFMQVGFFTRKIETELLHGVVPAEGMVFHGVEKHTIHVEHGCKELKLCVAFFFQI